MWIIVETGKGRREQVLERSQGRGRLTSARWTQQSHSIVAKPAVIKGGWGWVLGLGSNWEMEKKTVSRSNFFKKLGCELAKVAAAKTREGVD